MDTIYKRLETKSILIIEDDESTLKWLGRVLSLYFGSVYRASSASQALEIFKDVQPNIVLADIRLPDINGLFILQKIKLINKNSLRVVMTAYSNPAYLASAVQSGVHLYLKKPIDIDELLVAIISYLSPSCRLKKPVELGKKFIFTPTTKTITHENKVINLTKKELLLFELLLKNRQGFITLELIEQQVWEDYVSADAIRMVIVGLRKKLYPELIINLKGLGYKLNLP